MKHSSVHLQRDDVLERTCYLVHNSVLVPFYCHFPKSPRREAARSSAKAWSGVYREPGEHWKPASSFWRPSMGDTESIDGSATRTWTVVNGLTLKRPLQGDGIGLGDGLGPGLGRGLRNLGRGCRCSGKTRKKWENKKKRKAFPADNRPVRRAAGGWDPLGRWPPPTKIRRTRDGRRRFRGFPIGWRQSFLQNTDFFFNVVKSCRYYPARGSSLGRANFDVDLQFETPLNPFKPIETTRKVTKSNRNRCNESDRVRFSTLHLHRFLLGFTGFNSLTG